MRVFLETVSVALSMFSSLPVPQIPWTERNLRYVLCAFPLVGGLIALLWWSAAVLCFSCGLPALLRAAILCLLPVAVTGGIHLDGYADTCDALASHASPGKMQEILRDPHCGAFAVIRLCTHFVGSFALCGALSPDRTALFCLSLSFVLSRTLSGLAIVSLPSAKSSGLAHSFAAAADKRRVRTVLGVLAAVLCAALCLIGGVAGFAVVLTAGLCAALCARTALHKFGGLSGDLAGWFLQKTELWMLAAVVLVQYAGPLLLRG